MPKPASGAARVTARPDTSTLKWWEREPLRFECQADCFKCCLKPGVIYFDGEDIRRVALHLGVTQKDFKAAYLSRDDGHFVLEVSDRDPCPFLTAAGCGIHDAKPKQCQTYPFWRENLDHPSTWKLVGVFCPGVGKGPMVAIQAIKRMLNRFRL